MFRDPLQPDYPVFAGRIRFSQPVGPPVRPPLV
jgi:hypothetical protein